MFYLFSFHFRRFPIRFSPQAAYATHYPLGVCVCVCLCNCILWLSCHIYIKQMLYRYDSSSLDWRHTDLLRPKCCGTNKRHVMMGENGVRDGWYFTSVRPNFKILYEKHKQSKQAKEKKENFWRKTLSVVAIWESQKCIFSIEQQI